MRSYPVVNKIVTEKATRGTETSKYPEEEKETSIPQVAASEQGRAQTMSNHGVVGHSKLEAYIVEAAWKGLTQRVRSP